MSTGGRPLGEDGPAGLAAASTADEPATAPRRLGRVPAFDGVRGIAVLLVVWFHIGLLRALPSSVKPVGGFLGVDAFFVLSGFLITALLLREQTNRPHIRFGAFYRRRALRLLPVVFAFGIAHAIFAFTLGLSMGRERASVMSLLFYYVNWKAIYAPPLAPAFGHLWSLSVEEQFYLIWPVAMLFLTLRGAFSRTVVIVLGCAIAFIAINRAFLFEHGASVTRLLVGTDTRADTILIGALLAHLWVRRRVPTRRVRPAAWIAVAFLAFSAMRCTYTTTFLYLGGFTLVALAVAAVLLAVLETEWEGTRFLQLRPLRAVGRVSYGLYVWHPLVFLWVLHYTVRWSAGARLSTALAVTALVTVASWKFLEQPFLRWKNRLEAADSRKLTSTPGATREPVGPDELSAVHGIS